MEIEIITTLFLQYTDMSHNLILILIVSCSFLHFGRQYWGEIAQKEIKQKPTNGKPKEVIKEKQEECQRVIK